MSNISLLRGHAAPIARFGDVSICAIRTARHAGVGRAAALQPGSATTLQILFILSGNLRVCTGDLQFQLSASDWFICGADQTTLWASQDIDALLMTIPATTPVPTRNRVHSATSGVGNILLTCIRSALKVADELTPQARAELGNSLDDLARLAMRERAAPSRRISGRGIMRERVKAFVRHRLRDSTLSINDIAQTFNCTKRYLHKVFSEDERSLNQYIWELRLDRCSHDLASRELLDRSITQIAFVWGFRSSPHFSRAFRQRFGVSPSVYRSAQLRATAPSAIGPRLVEARPPPTNGLHDQRIAQAV